MLRRDERTTRAYTDISNQWASAPFHSCLDNAVNFETLTYPDLSQDDRDGIELMVLGLWLNVAIPAGNG